MTVVAGRRRRSAEDAKVTRLNVVIDHEAYKRLMVNSAMEGLSPGLLLEQLINDHCKTWSLPARGRVKSGAPVDPVESKDRPDGGAALSQEISAA